MSLTPHGRCHLSAGLRNGVTRVEARAAAAGPRTPKRLRKRLAARPHDARELPRAGGRCGPRGSWRRRGRTSRAPDRTAQRDLDPRASRYRSPSSCRPDGRRSSPQDGSRRRSPYMAPTSALASARQDLPVALPAASDGSGAWMRDTASPTRGGRPCTSADGQRPAGGTRSAAGPGRTSSSAGSRASRLRPSLRRRTHVSVVARHSTQAVGVERFELSAFASRTQRATKLRYTPWDLECTG